MKQYTDFAGVYDKLMDDVPYDEWAERVGRWLASSGILPSNAPQEEAGGAEDALREERGLVVDLGCGTGRFTEALAAKGYDMIGIDQSADMLGIAAGRREAAGSGTLYLQQDMREIDLYSTVGAFVSVCDSVNYLLTEEDVLACFRKVNNFLCPGGVFIFDFHTLYYYRQVLGERTIAEDAGDVSFIWENYYDAKSGINEYDLTIFVREQTGGAEDLYRRFSETHCQRAYTLTQMKRLLEKAGLEFVAAYGEEVDETPARNSTRVYVIARENRKQNGG